MNGKKNTISSEKKFENNWWSYWIDNYIMPNGKKGEYHYVHTGGSTFIVPLIDEEHVLMLKQFRYLTDRVSLEFPGGGIKEGQDPKEIARKELIEEIKYDAELEYAGSFNPYIGVTTEFCHVFIARNLRESVEFPQDDSEEFEVVKLSLQEVEEKVISNEIFNGMSLAIWALVRSKLLK
ncbi:MAG: NUDIX hydrolase [Ignavibacteriae bacterium]|nr:MAG: NUDIX hydrolase [Ignavibacteriota bacterium]